MEEKQENLKTNFGNPFGNNIRFQPQKKDKIIGDTSKYYLYGKVLSIGDEVIKVKPGDTIEVTQWALNKTIMQDGEERFYVQENSDFILNIW